MLRKNHDPAPASTRATAGVIAAGVLAGGIATVLLFTGEWLEPRTADAQASAEAAAAAPKEPAPASAPATSPATKPAAAAKGKSIGRPASKGTAVKTATDKPGRATAGAVVQSPAHLDDQVAYQYNALGRRDPFQSLVGGEYVGADVGGTAPPDVGGLKVVGIVWGDADQFALVEDARGDSHILRRGDKVMNGYVETLKRDAMIVNLTLDGQSQSVRVPLTRKGDKANASR
jgi:hypothetical protein